MRHIRMEDLAAINARIVVAHFQMDE